MTSPQSPIAVATDPVHGVTLEQYAGITVGLADELPLEGLLANEGLALEGWREAAPAWKARLALDGVEGAVFTAFCDKRREAEDWLGRSITPIGDDLGAWLAFLRAWAAHPAPFEMLAVASLRMNDVARLQRRWARRMAADVTLQKRAAELAEKSVAPLPAIHAEPVVLKPFPWSKASQASQARVTPSESAARAEADDQRWLVEHRRARASAGASAPSLASAVPALAPLPEVPPAAPPGLTGTGVALNVPRGPALPFVEGAPLADLVSPPVGERAVPRPHVGLGDTSLALDGPRQPVLPFVGEADPAPPAPSHLAETSLLLDVPRSLVLPFASALPAEAAPSALAPELRPSPQALAVETSLALEVPRGPVVPFVAPARPEASRSAAPAAPRLTLEQHASLSVEVDVAPARFVETLARYRLTPVQKRELDVHYAQRFGQDPALRDAWDGAYRTYRAWLLEQPGRRS